MPELVAASSLPRSELAGLFNAGYSDYYVPLELDAALDGVVAAWDIELESSRVAHHDDEPAGFAFLAIRGDQGWIGGMGVAPRARRRGLGEAVMRGVIDVAREREPWQRADEAVARRPATAPPLKGLVVDGGAAIVGVRQERVGVLQLVAEAEAARALIAAAAALAPKLLWINVPSNDPAAAALRDLGGHVFERQRELVLRPG